MFQKDTHIPIPIDRNSHHESVEAVKTHLTEAGASTVIPAKGRSSAIHYARKMGFKVITRVENKETETIRIWRKE